jgi:Protein of unknown function (DUF935)
MSGAGHVWSWERLRAARLRAGASSARETGHPPAPLPAGPRLAVAARDGGPGDPWAWARRSVELIRTAALGRQLHFLPWLDNYTKETPELRQAYREMLREPTVKAALSTKVLAVASLDVLVHPQDEDDPRQREVADALKHALTHIPGGWGGMGGLYKVAWNLLLPMLLDGWALCEPVFNEDAERQGKYAGKILWRDFKAKDTRYLLPLVDEFKNVTGLRALAHNAGRVWEGEELGSFVTCVNFQLYESPLGISDMRAAYRAFWVKDTTWKMRGLHLDKFTSPFFVGTYAEPAARAALEEELAKARANTWLTVPQGCLVQPIVAGSGTSDYEAAIEDCDKEILVSIVGAYLQILEGATPSGRGDTGIHKETSELFQWALATLLGQVITHQLAPPWVELNYGDVPCPTVTLGAVSEDDLLRRASVDRALQGLGMKLSKKEAYAFYGRQEPADPADVLEPPAPGAAPGGLPFAEGEGEQGDPFPWEGPLPP